MRYFLLMIVVVGAVKVTSNTKAKAEAGKPLTKEESVKVIEAAIREHLNKPEGELTEADMEKVTRLNLNRNQLTDVPKGLEKLTQLTLLELNNNKLTDVKSLENLTQLESLHLGGNQLTDVTGLEKLTQLKELTLADNKLTSVKDLEKLTKLNVLYLEFNKLTDVKGLEKLTQLKTLWLRFNQLTEVTGLEKLTQLTSLDLRNNPALTKAQIAELQKALPKCIIHHSNPTKQPPSLLPIKIPQRLGDLDARPEQRGISP